MAIEVLKWRPRGSVMFGIRDETKTPVAPGVFGLADCVDQISLALNVNYLSHIAKCSTVDAEDARDIKDLSAEVTIDFSNFVTANLLLALQATKVAAEVAPASVTNEELPTVADGESVLLGGSSPNFNVTTVTITDSATTPATVTPTTKYTVDAANGVVTFLDVAGYTQPFVAAYSHENPSVLAGLAAGRLIRWIRFNGFNIVDANKLVNVDIFKAQASPTSAFDLLPDDYGKLQMKFAAQIDLSRPSNNPRGQFFSVARA